jgi:hypothetical protein
MNNNTDRQASEGPEVEVRFDSRQKQDYLVHHVLRPTDLSFSIPIGGSFPWDKSAEACSWSLTPI